MARTADIQVRASSGSTTQELHSDALQDRSRITVSKGLYHHWHTKKTKRAKLKNKPLFRSDFS